MNLIFPSERFSVATLPKYPWQRKQYNAIADAARKTYINPRDTHPLLGEQLVTNTSTHENNPNKDWISNYSRMMLPWLHHHKIQNAVVLPGAAFIETMIAAAAASSESDSVDEIHLRNVQFHKFHYSPKSEGVLFTSLIKLDERDKTEICIRTRNKNDNSWTLNATCDLDLSSEMRKSSNERYIDLDEIQSRCDTSIPCDTLYDKLAEDGVILAVVGSKQNGGSICWEKEWVAVDYEGGSKLLEISDVPEKLEYFLIPDKKGVTKKLINLLENTHNGLLNDIHVCDTSTDAETLLSPDINARARHVVFMQMIDECSSLNDITKETFIDSQVNKAIACIQSTLIQSIERTENVFFWIVTKGAVLARPSDKVINPLMSKALALVLTCMNEHPDIFVAAIDLPHDLSPVDCALCLSYFFDNPLLSENCLALRVRNDNINESNIELYALRLNTKPTADLVFTKKSQDWMINLDEIAQKSRGGFIRPWDRNKSLDHNVIGSTCSKQQIVVEAYIQQPYKSLGDTDQSKSGFLFAGQVLSVLPSSDTEETKPAFVGFCRSHIVTSVVQTSMSNIVPVPLKVRPLDALVTIASCLPLYIALNNTFQDSDHHVVLLTSGNDPLHVKLIELLSNSTGCNIQLSVLNIDRKEERYFNTDGVLSELKSSSIDTLIIHPNVTIDDKKMTPLLEKLRFFGTLVTFCSGTWKHPLILDQQIHVKTIDLEILRSCDHHLFLNGSITSLLQLFFPDNGDSYLMCPSSAKIASINDASGVQLCGESVVCTNHTIPIDVSYRFGDSMMAFEAETFASYLVVGGSKGLGFEIVRWLANQGAQVVYFTGRSSPDGDIAEEVKRLQNASYTLEFIKCDASDENQTTQMLAHIKDRSKYPLRGIFHCAALFADQRLQNARREDWCKVVLPKAYGALLLHQITQKLDIKLSQFVVFSSIVEFLGNDGQGGYCCANAFLTSLCLARRLEGLPATVIAPGAVASVGFAAREGFVQLFEARGMYGVNPAEVCKSLSWSLGTDAMFGLTGF
ncbi:polyketide synthase 2 [Apostichopus japonicus]|uniref:Polyketide synthase 2 n=1 Tax=Stichopus japonicus TaxID=307972 RepID=A0A2G8JER3_STIJA|nr:polyketide synthase 2 [Apostichopus japonicus]